MHIDQTNCTKNNEHFNLCRFKLSQCLKPFVNFLCQDSVLLCREIVSSSDVAYRNILLFFPILSYILNANQILGLQLTCIKFDVYAILCPSCNALMFF